MAKGKCAFGIAVGISACSAFLHPSGHIPYKMKAPIICEATPTLRICRPGWQLQLTPVGENATPQDDNNTTKTSGTEELSLVFEGKKSNKILNENGLDLGATRSGFVATLYLMTSILSGMMALLVFLMPDKTNGRMLATKFGGAAGFILFSVVLKILRSADKSDKLASATNKRLNLGCLGFCAIGMAAVPGEAGFFANRTYAFAMGVCLFVMRLLGGFVAFAGWEKGVASAPGIRVRLLQELAEGTGRSIRGIFRVKNKKASQVYRNFLFVLGLLVAEHLLAIVFTVRYFGILSPPHLSYFQTSLRCSALARLFLISTIVYSLKEEGEQNRLGHPTSITLNWLMVAWTSIVGVGQYLTPQSPQGMMLLLAFPFVLRGFRGDFERKGRVEPLS